MKTFTIIASLLLTVGTISAQTTKTTTPMMDKEVNGGSTVPQTIRDKFNSEYPGEQPVWTMENGNYRAMFVDGSKMFGHAIAYDKSGAVTYREEKVSSYPSGVTDYYTTNYPNDKYDVWASTDKGGKRKYYSNHNLETLWFDENGKFTNKSTLKNK